MGRAWSRGVWEEGEETHDEQQKCWEDVPNVVAASMIARGNRRPTPSQCYCTMCRSSQVAMLGEARWGSNKGDVAAPEMLTIDGLSAGFYEHRVKAPLDLGPRFIKDSEKVFIAPFVVTIGIFAQQPFALEPDTLGHAQARRVFNIDEADHTVGGKGLKAIMQEQHRQLRAESLTLIVWMQHQPDLHLTIRCVQNTDQHFADHRSGAQEFRSEPKTFAFFARPAIFEARNLCGYF